MQEETNITVGAVLDKGAAYLAARTIAEARLKCELLAARLLQCERLNLSLHYHQALPEAHVAAMRRGLKRLADGEPIQYILGETQFRDHVFKVDRRALIPRPETEGLVQAVLDAELPEQALVADIGTGSGCIAISLALARPGWRCLALDPDAAALALARENAQALDADARVVCAGAELSECVEPEALHAVVANLPYVTTADWEALPATIRDFEPRRALDGGPDGLAVLRAVVPDAAIALVSRGPIFLEIGADQAGAVRALLESEGFVDVRIAPDLSGRDRIVSGRLGL